ncbi:GlsB/YeaQ/YmgE family stress response membrane protein [Gimesia sp.]|uniref:GlsB/YeaQ/YmgE family stress response membrane protein n=1 Tax=Gimesia sp. TaxID=2024833 RepID=UPI0032EDD4D1
MFDENMTQILQEAVNEMLVWVGFGTLVGLAAKAIMPGKDPGGAVSTMLMGIGGSVVGCGTLMFFWDGARVTPISSIGFLAATGGAFILLFFYRMLAGSFFAEAEDGERWLHRRRRRRRARGLADETY